MKKTELKKEKLGIKKFQISKINNPQLIIGGNANLGDDDDGDHPTLVTK
ncbi:hypothetical protein FORMB_03290 [Formosa sp. Hel1_33_131]|nr:hypothetical protein [Formosa sp. Hel1_33_131]AOR27390.1 hypothetical protein FORMB_03290 [Formosa sp. Hel1_33_131]